jgi:Putative zinc- or iron-chelating domain
MTRQCGDCQLCCKLLPMQAGGSQDKLVVEIELLARGLLPPDVKISDDFAKPAGQRCPHQRHHKGCNIYPTRPFGCRMWSCAWLSNDGTNALPRPDRSHMVIDCTPDFVRNDGVTYPVVQVWLDPDFPEAHKDSRFREFVAARGKDGYSTLVRTSAAVAFLIVPPVMASDHQWHEIHSKVHEHEHSIMEKVETLGEIAIKLGSPT